MLPAGPGRRFAVAAVVVLSLAFSAQASAAGGALGSLRAWGAATGRLPAGAGNAAVEARLAVLRKLVPAAARQLHAASQAARDDELHASRHALDVSLGPLPGRLSPDRAFFLFESYQAELERLSRLAGLERAPTGRVMLVTANQPTVAQTEDELGTDSDSDGVLDSSETDDDNDGVADAKDATSHGWGIPDAFAARPCVRVTEEIPSFRTVAGAAEWLRLAIADRKCKRPRAKRDVQAPRQLRKLGVEVTGARVHSDQLTVTVRARRATKLHVAVHAGHAALATAKPVAVKAGKRTLKLVLDKAPSDGMHTLRVTATQGARRAVGTAAVAVGANAQPIHDTVGKPDSSPLLPTPVVHGGKLVDERVPEGGNPEKGNDPLAPCPDENTDSDGDGVPNCVELRGFSLHVFVPGQPNVLLPGQAQIQKIHVTSNPHKANTDEDAETHGGHTYALTDGQEWANAQAGGISDPSSKDADGDGLTDVAEIYRWGTNPAATDTDSDARGPKDDQPPSAALYDGAEVRAKLPTSPTLADTDGDGNDDYTEIVSLHSNPRVAQVPSFDIVRAPDTGVSIAIPATTTSGQTTLSSQLNSQTRTDTQTDSKATDVTTENKGLVDVLGSLKNLKPSKPSGGGGGKTRAAPRFLGSIINFATTAFDVASPYLFGSTQNKSTTMEISKSNASQVQSTYETSIQSTTTLGPEGTITASFRIRNTSSRAIEVRGLSIAVFAPCLPLGSRTATTSCIAGQLAPLGTLTSTESKVTLDPNASSAPLNFSGKADSTLLQSVLGNPGALVFRPHGTLYDPRNNNSYAGEIGETLNRRTGGMTIDFGDGRVEPYTVAAGVDRGWGNPDQPVGERVDTILESLGLALGCPDTGATNCIEFGDAESRGRMLLAAGDPADRSQPAKFAQPVNADGTIPGAWVVFGSTQTALGTSAKPASVNLETARIAATDHLTLAYAADNDGDRLFDREEHVLGTSDASRDTDGDGATTSGFASDYFEARVGWLVSYPKGTVGRRVYSSPTSCDGDQDGLSDGPGIGCPPNLIGLTSELQLGTNPNNADTNGDGIEDGAQQDPLATTAVPTVNTTINGADLSANGGSRSGTGWHLDGVNQVVEPSGIALCSNAGSESRCSTATGYYRVTFNVTRDAGDSTAGSAYASSDPEWARISIDGTVATTRVNPSTGRTETVADTENYLTARLQNGEVRSPGVNQSYQVFLQVPQTLKPARIAFRLVRGPGATVNQVTIAAISRQQYFDAGYQSNGTPNPGFAGMAVPARELHTYFICRNDAADPTRSGPQGVLLTDRRQVAGPVGLHLPAGGYRFGFWMRGTGGPARNSVFLAATRGPSWPDSADYCESALDENGIPDYGVVPAHNTSRTTLTAGSLSPRDMPSSALSFNLLAQESQPISHLSLDAVADVFETGTDPVLEHIDIDPTPTVLASLNSMGWWGLGLEANPPSERAPSGFSAVSSGGTFSGTGASLPLNGKLMLGPVPVSSQYRWYVKTDANGVNLTNRSESGATQSTPTRDFNGWLPGVRCGSATAACGAQTSTVIATHATGTGNVGVSRVILMRRL